MVFYTGESYFLAGIFLQRGIALVYLIAFLVIVKQYTSLVGENGLYPIKEFISNSKFIENPSLFYLLPDDRYLELGGIIGLTLAFITLVGVSDYFSSVISIIVWTCLWVLFISFRNTGQLFWRQGAVLVEAGFLAIFLGVIGTQASEILIWLFRWTLFRVMFNSGLTKLKGDKCWRNLSSLNYQFETQPFPSILSWNFHHLPTLVKKFGVIFTFFAMLVVPWFYFAPQPYSAYAGAITILYQINIFLSGNYSWLNLTAIVLAFSTFSDQVLTSIIPILDEVNHAALQPYPYPELALLLSAFILVLSINPAKDMFFSSKKEITYGKIPIVNIYGKFPEVEKERKEIVIKGTNSGNPDKEDWKEYRFQYLPPCVDCRPPQVAPYYHRLDYAIYEHIRDSEINENILERIFEAILEPKEDVLRLFKQVPFEEPPDKIKADLYRYEFTEPRERDQTGNYWKREKLRTLKEN